MKNTSVDHTSDLALVQSHSDVSKYGVSTNYLAIIKENTIGRVYSRQSANKIYVSCGVLDLQIRFFSIQLDIIHHLKVKQYNPISKELRDLYLPSNMHDQDAKIALFSKSLVYDKIIDEFNHILGLFRTGFRGYCVNLSKFITTLHVSLEDKEKHFVEIRSLNTAFKDLIKSCSNNSKKYYLNFKFINLDEKVRRFGLMLDYLRYLIRFRIEAIPHLNKVSSKLDPSNYFYPELSSFSYKTLNNNKKSILYAKELFMLIGNKISAIDFVAENPDILARYYSSYELAILDQYKIFTLEIFVPRKVSSFSFNHITNMPCNKLNVKKFRALSEDEILEMHKVNGFNLSI